MSDPMHYMVQWLCSLEREGIKSKDMVITLPKASWLGFAKLAVDVAWRLENPSATELLFHGPSGPVRIRSVE